MQLSPSHCLPGVPCFRLTRCPNAGTTALHLASEAGFPAVVEVLLARGADANAVDSDGKTAARLASQLGHGGVVEAFRRAQTKATVPGLPKTDLGDVIADAVRRWSCGNAYGSAWYCVVALLVCVRHCLCACEGLCVYARVCLCEAMCGCKAASTL